MTRRSIRWAPAAKPERRTAELIALDFPDVDGIERAKRLCETATDMACGLERLTGFVVVAWSPDRDYIVRIDTGRRSHIPDALLPFWICELLRQTS